MFLRCHVTLIALALQYQSCFTVFHELKSEAEVIEKINSDKASVDLCDSEEAAALIGRGWWSATRELVTRSHEGTDVTRKTALERVVRREVTEIKMRSEELLLALSPQDADRIGVVRCALQWAQNSTTIFLSVKFAHRWSSPGALKVQDEKLEVSDCCFNFSATGDHSQLKKRYALDLHFYANVSQSGWSWQLASAGRMTVEIVKKTAGYWPRLLQSTAKQGNIAVWDSMQDRWGPDLKAIKKFEKNLKKVSKKSPGDEETRDEEQLHENGQKLCTSKPSSPFSREGSVVRLCPEYWPPRMDTRRKGRNSTWMVLFHSPAKLDCERRGPECLKVHDRWEAVGKKVPQVSEANIGAVDCDAHGDLCKEQQVGHLPYVRRYRDRKRKAYYGEWDIDSIMQTVLE